MKEWAFFFPFNNDVLSEISKYFVTALPNLVIKAVFKVYLFKKRNPLDISPPISINFTFFLYRVAINIHISL